MADDRPVKPTDEDIRHDDLEYSPAAEPRMAKAWLNLLLESEKAFESWNDHCDNIDKRYANLERLADKARDREFQMLWANCEVLKPSIYAKAPVPVVVPKFKDRRPVYQSASEVMERCATVAFDLTYINDLMLQIRDDVALAGRGVAWCRYESGKGKSNGYYHNRERVCIDFKHRRDFLHSVSRCWYEVTWVAAASYLTRAEARQRFYRHSGDAYQEAEYAVDKDAKEVGGADNRERAKFWEIWHKGEKRVVWVAKGCELILDEDDPHLDLQGFFPCPKPAYGTCQRGSLVPVPDAMQYEDQLDEVNTLTGRIHALADALEVKGFYPAGGAELAEKIEAAIKIKSPGRVLVPISNWAAFGSSKEVLIWLPIDQIAETINVIVTLRKQVIDDIYQIMGLSDIMRGATDARETLGAQQLKTEYGSSRIRDKQYELIRIARDLVVIVCEIICEKFANETIVEMSQTEMPTREMQEQAVGRVHQQIMMLTQQVQQAKMSPQGQQLAQQNPEQAQQMLQAAQQQMQQLQGTVEKIANKPTIEQVLRFLRDERARVFTLDIETDSTIMADENAEKQRRTEFVRELGRLMPQLAQMIGADPGSADLCGQILKFATAAFRTSRALDGSIDDYVEQIKAKGGQGKGDDPTTATNKVALQIEQLKQKTEMDKNQAMNALKAQELQLKDKHETMKIQSQQQIELLKLRSKQQDDAAKAAQTNQKAMAEREGHQADMIGKAADMRMNEQKMAMQQAAHIAKQQDMQARQSERQAAQQFKQSNRPPEGSPF
jgi:plasmid stabilization system protein ParE